MIRVQTSDEGHHWISPYRIISVREYPADLSFHWVEKSSFFGPNNFKTKRPKTLILIDMGNHQVDVAVLEDTKVVAAKFGDVMKADMA